MLNLDPPRQAEEATGLRLHKQLSDCINKVLRGIALVLPNSRREVTLKERAVVPSPIVLMLWSNRK